MPRLARRKDMYFLHFCIETLIPRCAYALAGSEQLQTKHKSSITGSQGSGSGITRPMHTTRDREPSQSFISTCTLHGMGLNNGGTAHVQEQLGNECFLRNAWKTLMKMITAKYCPRNEIKKLEIQIWNLKVKGTDLTSYTQCIQELALMCERMFPKESDVVEKYVGGLPDMIQGNVMSTKPKTMEEAIKMENNLMDQILCTLAKR
ncbi:reverse transcriptase domain-containing protein [Tanacetum coccineum]